MIKFIIGVMSFAILTSCKSKSKQNDENQKAKSQIEKKITIRDLSINSTNSYSDIFMDSMQVENYIAAAKINDTLSRRLRSFYNARNFQFAWFTSTGFTYQAYNFWNLHEYYTTYSKDTLLYDRFLKKKMNSLVLASSFAVKPKDPTFQNIELTLTKHFLQYLLTNYKNGEIKRKEMERFVPYKKQDVMEMADSLLTKKHKDNKYYSDVNPSYKALMQQLGKYYAIAKNNGWKPLNFNKDSLRKGVSSAAVLSLKKRLQFTEDFTKDNTSNVYDGELQNAVKMFQTHHGFTPTGVVTANLVNELNVPVISRIEQLLINMDRMRWTFNHAEGNLIVVNIPEFALHVFEGKKQAFKMPVVVGKEGHNTTIFTGNLNQIVFSPYWNVPPNIVKKEIMPSIMKDDNYLSRNNMVQDGEDEDGVPVIRQLPGPKNSLGKVKFLFPNSFNIYLHDTPAKDLFRMENRAYSHGCIRLGDPVKLANYLLRNRPGWTTEKIDQAMNSGIEQSVQLQTAVPVLITYFTAWVDENGVLNFRNDVYGHDAMLRKKMFF